MKIAQVETQANQARQWPRQVLSEALDKAIPASAIQQALEKTQTQGKRQRCMTGRVTVLQILAMCLWPSVSMRDCLRNLIEGCRQELRKSQERVPVRSAITAARKRLGVAPLRELLRLVAHPLATQKTKGAFYKDMRLVAFDGTTLDVPDTEENHRVFGRPGSNRGTSAFPQVRLLWLMEVATRAVLDFVTVPYCIGEKTAIPKLFRNLKDGMLVLWDRGFHSYPLWKALRATGAHLLARAQIPPIFKPIKILPDGSFLANIYPNSKCRNKNRHAILIRVIEYTITDPTRVGCRQKHRLITSLLDPVLYPAKELICLYHERWEIEIGLDEIKVHQNDNRPVLRSKTPRGVIQEVHGIMLVHFALCYLRHESALTKDIDPDRISFVHTIHVLQRAIPSFQRAHTHLLPGLYKEMLAEIAQEILPQRRLRCYPRVVKRKMSNFLLKRESHKRQPQPKIPFSEAIEILK